MDREQLKFFAYYQKNNLDELKLEAEKGNRCAEFYLGRIYYDRKDYNKAIKLFESSANKKYAASNTILGYMYSVGEGVLKDYSKAVKLFELSSEQGHSHGYYNLGAMYFNAEYVKEDKQHALSLFLVAASRGQTMAKEALNKFLEKDNLDYIINSKEAREYFINNTEFTKLLLSKITEQKQKIEELTKQNDFLKLYPGSDFREAEKDFDMLIAQQNKT